MSRRSRLHLPSAIYHVMLRGNDGQPIFFEDEDRCRMCLLIQEGTERFGHSIYSFCFMTNHIHLAIQVGETSISRIMQNLAFRYTRYINKKHKRIGHLFQGRFKSIIVDGNRYLKELVRYIHLNPVRANLVSQPDEYIWSSHRAYLMIDQYTWLTSDKILQKFGTTRKEAVTTYESFILKGIGIESELDFKSGHTDGIIGDDEFVVEFLETVDGLQKREIKFLELVTKVCKQFDLTETTIRAPGKHRIASQVRGILAFFVREIENLTIEELAVFLDRDPSGLSKLANRIEQKCVQLPIFAAEIDELRKWIYSEMPEFRPDPSFTPIPLPQMSECQA